MSADIGLCEIFSYLGERLAEEDLVALLDKVSDGESVLEDIT
jgi:hypothetical protein